MPTSITGFLGWPLRCERWIEVKCGYLYSIALDDGSILTAYGNYLAGGALINWRI